MSITSFLDTYTEYPMFLNIAGHWHEQLSSDSLAAQARCIDLRDKPNVSPQTLRLRHMQAYALNSCAQAMRHADAYVFAIDMSFGNMSIEPSADNIFLFRQTGGFFRFVIDTIATQWYTLPVMAGVALVCTYLFRNDGFDDALEKGCVLATMPLDFIATQISSMVGLCLKITLLLPVAGFGAIRGLLAADRLTHNASSSIRPPAMLPQDFSASLHA